MQTPNKYFFPVAFAMAVLPLLLEDLLTIFQELLGQVVETEALVHVEVLPVYENLPETVTVHKTVLSCIYETFLLPDVVFGARLDTSEDS